MLMAFNADDLPVPLVAELDPPMPLFFHILDIIIVVIVVIILPLLLASSALYSA